MEKVKESVVIDIDLPLENSLKLKLQQTQTWETFEPFILSRLPHIIRENNKELYEPKVVSIGPYHRNKESLRAMEDHKPRCLIDLLGKNPDVRLETCIQEIRKLEASARRCYSESISLNTEEFVEMLLLDGCFILDLFFKVRAREPHALLDAGWGAKTMIADLVLLENQIPFFVVEKLYAIFTSYEGDRNSLLYLLQPSSVSPDLPANSEIHHLLHLYYQWFIPVRISKTRSPRYSTISISPSTNMSKQLSKTNPIISWLNSRSSGSPKKPYKPMKAIPCATELHEAGIIFKRKESPTDKFNITFENGVMEIPTLPIDSTRRIIYMNFAAFERSNSNIKRDLMSYAVLMNSLIDSNKDVVLLQRSGIINNMLLNEEELAVIFNQLGSWSTLDSDEHYFASLFAEVLQYYESSWPKYRAKLMHDYFNNPWSALSVIAAVVLLILSAIQAAYSMYPYV